MFLHPEKVSQLWEDRTGTNPTGGRTATGSGRYHSSNKASLNMSVMTANNSTRSVHSVAPAEDDAVSSTSSSDDEQEKSTSSSQPNGSQ